MECTVPLAQAVLPSVCSYSGPVVIDAIEHRQQQLFQDGRALPPGSAGRPRHLAGDGKGLACPLRGDGVEASTVAVEHRLLASKLLPALHRNIDISRRDLNRVADAAGHLSRDYRRARAAERLVDGLPGRRIILDRPAHALDRLLRAVTGFRFQIFVDLPQRRLRMVADPRRGATLAHHVPARLVLAVVMAAADREVVFGPNDLRAGLEAAGG